MSVLMNATYTLMGTCDCAQKNLLSHNNPISIGVSLKRFMMQGENSSAR